mmetsp:Transcript_8033/g.33573  ORF Transcript_8033/g.33573 Transcript_8033/m.33573 type:complete len:288 (-) Transcript_8033:343-1206(-)
MRAGSQIARRVIRERRADDAGGFAVARRRDDVEDDVAQRFAVRRLARERLRVGETGTGTGRVSLLAPAGLLRLRRSRRRGGGRHERDGIRGSRSRSRSRARAPARPPGLARSTRGRARGCVRLGPRRAIVALPRGGGLHRVVHRGNAPRERELGRGVPRPLRVVLRVALRHHLLHGAQVDARLLGHLQKRRRDRALCICIRLPAAAQEFSAPVAESRDGVDDVQERGVIRRARRHVHERAPRELARGEGDDARVADGGFRRFAVDPRAFAHRREKSREVLEDAVSGG